MPLHIGFNLFPVGYFISVTFFLSSNVPSFTFCDIVLNPYNIFPYIYEVDYVKIWWLNQQCDTALTLCSFDPDNFNYAIYKSISLGGPGCTPTITNGNNVVLRATDGILLDKGFTVELGASLLTEITPCQDQEIYDRSQNSGYDNFPDQTTPHPGYIKMGHY